MFRLVVAVMCLAACGEGRRPRIRLFTDEEIATHEAALMQRVEARKHRRCERPILRGQPTPGPAAPDILAITEPSGELEACYDRINEVAPYGQVSRTDAAKLDDVIERCAGVFEAALAKAGSHVDACSPYGVGVYDAKLGNGSAHPDATWAFRTFVGEIARRRAAADSAAALRFLLDAFRFADDIQRGETFIYWPSSRRDLVAHALHILASHPPVDDELPRLIEAVDVLIASRPRVEDKVAAGLDVVELRAARRMHEPHDPCDLPECKSGADFILASERFRLDPEDGDAVWYVVSELQRADREKACPPTATLQSCADRFAHLSNLDRPTPSELDRTYAQLVRGAPVEEVRPQLRSAVVEILRRTGSPWTSSADEVNQHAHELIDLLVLRTHLALLRRARATKQCPPVDDLPSAELELPRGGGRIHLVPTNEGVEIVAPAWTGYSQPWNRRITKFRCP